MLFLWTPLVPIIVVAMILWSCVLGRRSGTCGRKSSGLFWVIFILLVVFIANHKWDLSSSKPLAAAVRSFMAPRSVSVPHVVNTPPLRSPSLTTLPSTTQESAAAPPWVSDWAVFLNSAKPGAHWLLAESAGYFATDQEARQSAQQQAVESIAREIRQTPGTEETLRQTIRGRLMDKAGNLGGMLVDEYFERVQRPYGEVWRCKLLIDTSASQLTLIQQFYESAVSNATRVQRDRRISTVGSMIALLAVIILLYGFLNAATKGYFLWRLRAAVVMVIIIGVLVVSGICNFT